MREASAIERLLRALGVAALSSSLAGSGPGQTPAQVLAPKYELLWTAQTAPGGSMVVVPSSDLDFDGWDDVLVGDYMFNNMVGKASALSGGSGTVVWETVGSPSPGPNCSPPWDLMGMAMAVLDWDGDGASDVAVAAPRFPNTACPSYQIGRVRVVRGSDGVTLAQLQLPPVIQGLATPGQYVALGAGLGVGGDLTGDGIGDLLTCFDTFWPATAGVSTGAVVAVEAGTGAVATVMSGSEFQESACCMSAEPEVGGALILPGTGPGSLGKIVFGSPYRHVFAPSGAIQYQWAGGLKVYGAGGGTPLLEVMGTGTIQHRGWQVFGGKDLEGDGYPDFAVLRWPYNYNQVTQYALPGQVLDVYSGATLQLLYSASVQPFIGAWAVKRADLVPDVSGDGLADIVVCSVGIGGPWAYDDSWNKIYEGDTGTEVEGWSFTDPDFLYGGYGGYQSRAVGDVNNDGWGDLGVVRSQASLLNSTTLQVFGRRNLGVTGSLAPGGQATLAVDTPKHAGRPFLLLFSAAPGPPVTVGPFVIPLAPDAVFAGSLQMGLVGTLDSAGEVSLAIPIPNDPSLSGATVYTSGVVVDPASSYGIGTILTRLAVTIL
jgi:hypothetical protein